MSIETSMSQGQIVDLNEDLSIHLLSIQGIEYERAPGGKIIGLKAPPEFIIPLILRSPSGKNNIKLKKTKTDLHPSAQWNKYRITFMSIESYDRGYKINLKTDIVPLPKIEIGMVSNTMRSGDELQGPEELIISHSGYTNGHTMNSSGKAGTLSNCMIQVKDGKKSKIFNVDAPLLAPVSFEWSQWIFTFIKTDSNGGTMPSEEPIQFKITKK